MLPLYLKLDKDSLRETLTNIVTVIIKKFGSSSLITDRKDDKTEK